MVRKAYNWRRYCTVINSTYSYKFDDTGSFVTNSEQLQPAAAAAIGPAVETKGAASGSSSSVRTPANTQW